jgi:hypothetical protein
MLAGINLAGINLAAIFHNTPRLSSMAAAASGVTAKEVANGLLLDLGVGPRSHLSAVDAHPELKGVPLPREAGRHDACGNLVQGTNIVQVGRGEVCLCYRCMLLERCGRAPRAPD